MIKASNIQAELSKMKVLHGRTRHTPEEEESDVFAELSTFNDGGVYVGSFSGETAWERHSKGDELVHVLDGAATLTILTDSGDQQLELTKGSLVVVPKGKWHRFQVPKLVTLLTATPLPTDLSSVEDPR